MDGEEPLKVSAVGGAYLSPDIFDTTLTTLEFGNGIKGHVFVSWLHPFKEQKLVVVGSNKMAVFDDISEEKLFIYPHKITWEKGKIPVALKADYNVVDFEKKQPLAEELIHFIDCVENRKTPRTDGREGLRVLKILEKAQETLKQ
jgi:UDP-2-acetamido-3-amino-2,3-dideoxy-glucuronate N-acetyltransferase